MVVYFTGPGNSRYCARLVARQLEDGLMDSFHFIRDGIAAELVSEKPWVFVSPTYAWRLPRVFEAFLRSGFFSGSREAYFVMTCGSGVGAPEPYIHALGREKGLVCRGVLQVVMPENYIAMFDAPREAQARQIISAALPALEEGGACIREGRDFPPRSPGLADRLKSGPVNPLFYRFCVKAGPFHATAACVACGKCARVCPLGSIRLEDGRPVWEGRCTHCMACICGCPEEAIKYGKASRGKPRYQCPSDQETR